MKRAFHKPALLLAITGFVVCAAGRAATAQPAPDLFTPELILRHAEEIALTPEQHRAISATMEEPNEAIRRANERLKTESEAFNRLLGADPVDEAALLRQLDAILATEREAKLARLMLMIRANRSLTLTQRGKLAELKRSATTPPTNATQARVTAKLERLKQAAERRQQQGLPTRPGREFWDRVEPLIKSGQWDRAERMIDRATEAIETGRRPGPRR